MRSPRRAEALLAALAIVLAAGAAACGGGGGDDAKAAREADAEMIVESRVGEDVTCKDVGAVNVELHPDALVNYNCTNDDDEHYFLTIAPDREIRDLSGPIRLKPVSG